MDTAMKKPLNPCNGPLSRPAQWLAPPSIALLTIAAFLPTLRNGFVNWDDTVLLSGNPHYRGLGWTQLRWMFTTFHMGHYQPLSWLTYGLGYLLWGMNPVGYHLTSLLLHAAAAVVFYFVARRLLRLALPGLSGESAIGPSLAAAFAALLFSLHPLRVESVAWATERRDVLCGLFYLLTLLAYLRAVEGRPSRRWLAAAVGLSVLALLSKVMAVSLPVLLVILDVYPLRRLGGGPGRWVGRGVRQVWWEKVPFVLVAAPAALLAPFATAHAGIILSLHRHGLAARLAVVVYGLAFYLWKTVVPLGLSPLYELPVALNPLDSPYLLSGLVVLGLSLLLLLARRRWPAGLALWSAYVAILLPVQGNVQIIGYQIAADRYTYLACLGWALLGGAGLLTAWHARRSGRLGLPAVALLCGLALIILVGLGGLTWRQVRVWHDSLSLWTHALTIDPRSAIAHNNLGIVLANQGKLDQAIAHYQEALRVRPTYSKGHDNLGVALAKQGRLAAAEQEFTLAVRYNPANAAAQLNLANVYAMQGKDEQAEAEYRRLLALKPTYAKAYLNLGLLLRKQGRSDEGIALLQRALALKPENVTGRNALGLAYLQQGRIQEGISE